MSINIINKVEKHHHIAFHYPSFTQDSATNLRTKHILIPNLKYFFFILQEHSPDLIPKCLYFRCGNDASLTFLEDEFLKLVLHVVVIFENFVVLLQTQQIEQGHISHIHQRLSKKKDGNDPYKVNPPYLCIILKGNVDACQTQNLRIDLHLTVKFNP